MSKQADAYAVNNIAWELFKIMFKDEVVKISNTNHYSRNFEYCQVLAKVIQEKRREYVRKEKEGNEIK